MEPQPDIFKPEKFNIKPYDFQATNDVEFANDLYNEILSSPRTYKEFITYPTRFNANPDYLLPQGIFTSVPDSGKPKGIMPKKHSPFIPDQKTLDAVMDARTKYAAKLKEHMAERQKAIDKAFPPLKEHKSPEEVIILKNLDLRQLNLKEHDFTGTKFVWDDSTEESKRLATIIYALKPDFNKSNLKNTSFNLRNVPFNPQCNEADLTGAHFEGNGKGVNFCGSFQGANLQDATFANLSFSHGINCKGANLQGATFKGFKRGDDTFSADYGFIDFRGAQNLETIKVDAATSFAGMVGISADDVQAIGEKNGMAEEWIKAQTTAANEAWRIIEEREKYQREKEGVPQALRGSVEAYKASVAALPLGQTTAPMSVPENDTAGQLRKA